MEVTNARLACLASTRTGALVLMVGHRRVPQKAQQWQDPGSAREPPPGPPVASSHIWWRRPAEACLGERQNLSAIGEVHLGSAALSLATSNILATARDMTPSQQTLLSSASRGQS